MPAAPPASEVTWATRRDRHPHFPSSLMGQAAGAGIVRIRINGSGLNQTFTDCPDGCGDSPPLGPGKVPPGSRRWLVEEVDVRPSPGRASVESRVRGGDGNASPDTPGRWRRLNWRHGRSGPPGDFSEVVSFPRPPISIQWNVRVNGWTASSGAVRGRPSLSATGPHRGPFGCNRLRWRDCG